MQNSTLRNFVLYGPISIKLGVIDYVSDPYEYANLGWIWLGGKFPANRWNRTSLWLFVVSIFQGTCLEQKPLNGFARSLAQNA